MKFKRILTFCMAGFALSAMAQTHVEGSEYYRADQFDNAKELLLRSLKNPGTDKAVSDYYLGLIALRDNNKAEAQKYFNEGIQINPEYPNNYVGLGSLQLLNGNEKEAEQSFKTAESKSKKDASLQILIARAYDNADPVKYEKQITKRLANARKINIENPDIYIFEGDQFAEKKQWGDAGAKYEMAANYNNKATEAYVKYANLFTMVNPQYAVNMLTKLLQVNPNSALGERELAIAYYNNKDFANAAKQYGKYVTNASHFKQDEDRYAFLLFYSGDYKKGYDYATSLVKANPSNFTAQRYQFMNAAQLPELKEQLPAMAESLHAAHKSNPGSNKFAAIDYTLIADEYAKAKQVDKAIDVIKEGIADMPDNANFNKTLAMLYVDANNLTDATEAYKGYLQKTEEPGYNDYIQQATFSFYAGVENQESNPEKAAKFFSETKEYADKGAAILPDNYKPVMMNGDVAKQTASKEEATAAAVPYYEKAISLLEASQDPSRYARDAKTMYNYMGNYYLDQKNVEKAKEYFNKYLALDPNNADYRKFVESL